MILKTQIDVRHQPLIVIFLKANDLVGVVVTQEVLEIRGKKHGVLQLESTVEDTSIALTVMGLRHCGILNMLDDYLLKCGVSWDKINPKSMHRQIQDEKEEEQTKKFMDNLLQIGRSTCGKIRQIF